MIRSHAAQQRLGPCPNFVVLLKGPAHSLTVVPHAKGGTKELLLSSFVRLYQAGIYCWFDISPNTRYCSSEA